MQSADFDHYRFNYDEKSRLQRIEYFRNGKLHKDRNFKVAIISIEYHDNIEIRYYKDEKGNPIPNNVGIYIEKIIHKRGSIEISYYDKNQNHMVDNRGIAGYTGKLDDKDLVEIYFNLDSDGNPAADKDGIYETKFKYNDDKEPIEIAHYDLEGNLAINNGLLGAAVARISYDELGNVSEWRSFDVSLKPLNGEGAIVRGDYDDCGNITALYYFNKKDMLKLLNKLDRDGNFVEQYYFGNDGKLQGIEEWGGCAIIQKVYDDNGKVIEKRCYGPDSLLTTSSKWNAPIVQLFYDDKGNIIGQKDVHVDEKLRIDSK